MSLDVLGQVLAGLAPTVGVVLLFYVAVRAMVRADAGERRADEQFGAAQTPTKPDNGDGAQDPSD